MPIKVTPTLISLVSHFPCWIFDPIMTWDFKVHGYYANNGWHLVLPYTPKSILVGLFLSLLAIFSSSRRAKKFQALREPNWSQISSLFKKLFPRRIRISNSNILDWVLKKSPDICKKSIISNSERLRLIKWHRKKCTLHSTFALCGNKNSGLFL